MVSETQTHTRITSRSVEVLRCFLLSFYSRHEASDNEESSMGAGCCCNPGPHAEDTSHSL